MSRAVERAALLATLLATHLLTLGLTPDVGVSGTLRETLQAAGATPPASLPDLDQPVEHVVSAVDGAATVVVYAVTEPGGLLRLVALRVESGTGPVTRQPLVWPPASPLDPLTCQHLDSATYHAGRLVITAHINPSAACTLVLDPGLRLAAVLGGWPVTTFPDGRLLYQKNQVHFAAVHPLALHLFDPTAPSDVPLHPRTPDPPARAAHVARMRQVYTDAWCNEHNHPCDPELFDERRVGEVAVDGAGDALAFAVAFDNTTGWSDTERWGRLEAFRELRAVVPAWDGQAAPPATLAQALVAGLARARNIRAERAVVAALSDDPALSAMVAGILAAERRDPEDPARWLLALDPRWGDTATWRRLAALVRIADEETRVVYVYSGLRQGSGIRYRELSPEELERRFGSRPLADALEPATLRALFAE